VLPLLWVELLPDDELFDELGAVVVVLEFEPLPDPMVLRKNPPALVPLLR
jgi:hypothetical protein